MNDEITQEDIDLGKYIYSILISQPTILMSWGVESPVVIKQGLRFSVSGFLLKGSVQILYNEGLDLFDIFLINDDNTLKVSLVGIYFDELIDIIDEYVEHCDNYNEMVNQEYNLLNNDKEIV